MLARLREEFPRFAVVSKRNSPLSRAIDFALRVITVGTQRRYLTHYHTVLGYTLFLPDSWASTRELDRVIVLRHERIHLLQRRRLGMLPFAFLYLMPVLPLGLAYGRARLEWEAYRETLRATAELHGIEAARSPALRREIVGRFLDGSYGWMWPFRKQVEGWYAHAMIELEAVHGQGNPDRPCAGSLPSETGS
jgi:hypothetical protein